MMADFNVKEVRQALTEMRVKAAMCKYDPGYVSYDVFEALAGVADILLGEVEEEQAEKARMRAGLDELRRLAERPIYGRGSAKTAMDTARLEAGL
ncbi:hypothetical protein NSS79_10375 [Paenibacillus sp. FSL L8-0436]|uniref:hypothetical protein n=1 Tax=Paenibacillus sp. FSL L8-0436 TaxID=2954686 RepID=UPI0031589A57